MSVIHNDAGFALYPTGHENVVSEDTSFVQGDSPVTINVHGTLNANGNQGYIINDGPGDISIEIATSGVAVYGSAFTLKAGEGLDLAGRNVFRIRLTWVSNTAYRVHVW